MLRWFGIVGLVLVLVVAAGSLASRFTLDVSGISSFRVIPNVILPPMPSISDAAVDSEPDGDAPDSVGLTDPPSMTPSDVTTILIPIEVLDDGEESTVPDLGEEKSQESKESEQGDSTSDPEETNPPLDNPDQSEQGDPASGPKQDDPQKDKSTVGDEGDSNPESVNTDPSGNETGITDEGDLVQESASNTEHPVTFNIDEPVAGATKPEPQDDELDTVTKDEDEPVQEPVKTDPEADEPETQTQEENIPVKQPLEIIPPADENEAVEVEDDDPVTEPVDEPETVDEDTKTIIPMPTRPVVEQPEPVEPDAPVLEPIAPELPVTDPEDVEEDEAPVEEPATPDPPVDEPVDEPEEPEAVEHCPIDAELKIAPETLDLNGEVDELLFAVRFPESVAGTHLVDDVTLVEVRVKLGEEQYGTLTVEAKPDAENPRAGEFELTLEQVEKLLEGRLGELTLEVRGSVDDCAFAGTDTLEVIETEVEEPAEPIKDDPAEVADETGAGDDPAESEPQQTEPETIEEVQEQTEPVEEVEEQTEPTEEVQEQTGTTEGEETSQPQAVENTEPVGVVEEDEGVEDEEPDEPESE